MTGRLSWGVGITLVYTAFAIGTAAFAVFAMRQRVDLVSDDYYAQSLAEDARMAAVANADALGPAFGIDADDDGRVVTIRWPAAIASSAAGTVTLYRPSDARADRTIHLAPDARGQQQLSLANVPSGRWIVQVAWTSDGRGYYAEAPVMVR